jgi:hypothetical protein
VNTSAWDSLYTGTSAVGIDALLRAAGLSQLRYPGGSWADEYDWTTNTDSSRCNGSVTTACSVADSLGFETFSAQTRAVGASSFVTINYGSGTPAQAARWVSHARSDARDEVSMWEVGNESYSCYETNLHLASAPTFVKNYRPDGATCPSTATMAASYAANSPAYLEAMKQADPKALLGIPWAFSDLESPGAGVADPDTWNAKVLRADKGKINFVDAHWYPFNSTVNLSEAQLLGAIATIPAAAQAIRSTLSQLAPGATFIIGELGISERETTIDFDPESALFEAGASLEWLAQGATSADWWDLNNFGSPSTGDYGLLSSGSPEPLPAGTPLPAYYGAALAGLLAEPGSHLGSLSTGSPAVLGFESNLRGRRRILLINGNSSERTISMPNWFASAGRLQSQTYGPSTAGGSHPIVQATIASGPMINVPAGSIVVLTGTPG